MVRIALVSDDRLFCDGIVRILQTDNAFTVATYRSVAAFETADLGARADVALIDSRIDDAIAIAGTRRVAPASVLIAAPPDAAWCRDAVCAGASGVLAKDAGAAELMSAVRVVADGSVWAPRRVLAECIRHLVSRVARRPAATTHARQLSRREREIFRHAAAGLGNRELASRLAIGEATVKAHLTHIFQKLGVRGRAELAAVYHGVAPRSVDPPTPPQLFAVPGHSPMVVRPSSQVAAGGSIKK